VNGIFARSSAAVAVVPRPATTGTLRHEAADAKTIRSVAEQVRIVGICV
jgi:hypothetical protein